MSELSVPVRRASGPLTFGAPAAAVTAIQHVVSGELRGRVRPRVLEAGAGKRTRFEVPPDAYVVGVDTDTVAMSRNQRLDEQVVTDLAAYSPTVAFDLVTCWYVLEHVPDPADLLGRLADWTAPGGLLVLAVPHLYSPKSLVTKLTPHRFHVWFRRRVLGYPRAGTPGHGPYPTTLRSGIAPDAMTGIVLARGLRPVLQGFFEDGKQTALRHRIGLAGRPWRWLCAAVRLGTLGRLDAARSEYVLVARRPG